MTLEGPSSWNDQHTGCRHSRLGFGHLTHAASGGKRSPPAVAISYTKTRPLPDSNHVGYPRRKSSSARRRSGTISLRRVGSFKCPGPDRHEVPASRRPDLLDEAANAVMTLKIGGSGLRDWALAIAERTGPRKAKVALACKLAAILHAMWRTGTAFNDRAKA